MIRVVLKRILLGIPTLGVVMLATFLLLELMPGDPAAVLAGEDASPETIAVLRERLGLNRPFLTRFGDYFIGVLRGDLGESLITRRPVWGSITEALPATFSLALVSLTMVVVCSFAAGTLAALRRDGFVDRAVSAGAALGLAAPGFVVAILLIVPLAVDRTWFPATGYRPLSAGIGTWLHYLILPAFALAINSSAELTRQIRGAVVDTMGQDFVMTGRASGLPTRVLLGKHVMKNSATPIVTVLGLQIGRVLGGAVVVERVFAIPGFGSLAYNAVLQRDIPMVQGVVLVSAVIVVLSNLLVDISYPFFNPRLRNG